MYCKGKYTIKGFVKSGICTEEQIKCHEVKRSVHLSLGAKCPKTKDSLLNCSESYLLLICS